MAFCTQCGQQAGAADQFCSKCGAPQNSAATGSARGWNPAPPPGTSGQDPLANVSPRNASILCYVPTVGWIAAVVVLAARRFKTDTVVRFHAFQGLYLFAAWLMVQWVVRPMSIVFSYPGMHLDRLLEGLLLAVSVFMMFKASRDEAYVLPVIGELAQRSAVEQ